MKYVTFTTGKDDTQRAGIRREGTVYDLTDVMAGENSPFATLLETVTASSRVEVEALLNDATDMYDVDCVTLVPPLPADGRLFCLGGAYTSHLEERGRDLFTVPEQWYVPHSAVVGQNEPIVLPAAADDPVKPAAELGVVIGEGGRYIDETEALDHVAGFTISNDVTVRADWPGPRGYKIMDTLNPIGPDVTPIENVANPLNLDMTMQLDNTEICSGSTRGHRFTISFMISYMSTLIELRPGDILSTGDPGGVEGALEAGETLETKIESIGTLRNPVKAEEST